jgi:hypothetical protein
MYVSKPGTAAEMNVTPIELAMETGIASMLVPPHGLYPFIQAPPSLRATGRGGGRGPRARMSKSTFTNPTGSNLSF